MTKTNRTTKTSGGTCAALVGMAAICILLAACGTPTHVDKGPLRAGTFSFVHVKSLPAADFKDDREQMHSMIQDAITKNLQAKGLTRSESAGDLTIAYLVVVGNNVSTTLIREHFGYGRDTEALHGRAHKAYTGAGSPNVFKAGTLLIDIIDTETFELLNRNFVVRAVLKDPSAEVREENIQSAVDEALQNIRIDK